MSGGMVKGNAAGRRIKGQINLTEGSPGKSLLISALSLILGNLLQQFYNMADPMIAGNFVGENALAAVGTPYTSTNVFIMIVVEGGNEASVFIFQYLGVKQHGRMKISVSMSLITFLAVSLVLGGVGLTMDGRILESLNTPESITGQVRLYLGIYFLGLPFLFMHNVLAVTFDVMGNSRTSPYLFMSLSLLNVVLDIISVTWLGVGVDGVAIATVMAQDVSALISFALLLEKLRGYAQGPGDEFRFCDTRVLGSGTKITAPSILQQSIVSIRMLLVQSVVNGSDFATLAGYSAGSRIESICVVLMITTGNAVATFTAQNIGAGRLEWVKKGYRTNYGVTIGFSVLIAVVVSPTNGPIIASFLGSSMSSDTYVAGTGYLSFTAYFFVLIGLKMYVDDLLRESGNVLMFAIADLVNLAISVLGAFHFTPVWGIVAVWYTVPMGRMVDYAISFVRHLAGK